MNLRLKTIIGIAVIESTLLLLLILSGLNYITQSNETQLIHYTQTTSRLFASASKDALIATDLASLEALVISITHNPDIVYARIMQDDLVMAESGQLPAGAKKHKIDTHYASVDDGIFDIETQVVEGGEIFGTFFIGFSIQHIDHAVRNARFWATTIAVIEILLVAIFSFLIGTYLVNKLKRLREATETIANSGPGHLIACTGHDEIARLIQSFNRMSRNLSDADKDLRSTLKAYKALAMHSSRKEAINQAILSTSLDAIITLNDSGKIIEYNAGAFETFGWHHADAIEQPMTDFLMPEDLQETHATNIQQYLTNREHPLLGKRIQLNARHKSGHVFPIELSISPIRIEGGTLFTTFIRDMTLEKQNAQFLTLARHEAEQASAAKSRFLATMSHEIRSPLNAVINMNALLLESQLTPEQHQFATIANQGGQTLMSLINDILDFSQIESGKTQLHCAWHNVMLMAERTLELFSSQAQEKSIQLMVVVSPSVAKAYFCDEVRVRQILTNLVSNAIKFTPTGGVIIRLTTGTENTLCLEVEDTGIGVAQDQQERIFGEFSQADDADNRCYGGSGLGLAIVSRLTALMHGHLSLSSEEDKGTCIKITLPLKTQQGFALPVVDQSRPKPIIYLQLSNPVARMALREQFEQFALTVRDTVDLAISSPMTPHVLFVDEDIQGVHLAAHQRLTNKINPNAVWRYISMIPMQSISAMDRTKGSGYDAVIRTPARSKQLIHYLYHNHVRHEPCRAQAKQSPPNTGQHILLVEDSEANQAVATAILNKLGYHTVIANNGLEAVQLCAKTPFSLILMDLAMPIMDGIEATRRIRKQTQNNRQTPIIAMTANAFVQDQERCYAAGMSDYLCKPLDIVKFRQTLHQWLQQNSHEYGQTPSGTSDPPPNKLIDEAILEALADDTSWAVLSDILNIYFKETKIRIPRMVNHVSAHHYDDLSAEAHALKSSSGSFGAIRLEATALEIEIAAKNVDVATLAPVMAGLEHLAAESMKCLQNFLRDAKQSL